MGRVIEREPDPKWQEENRIEGGGGGGDQEEEEGGGREGSSQSALCKQASSRSGQVAGGVGGEALGGVLHGPVGLSAEQITDGRNVLFVLKKH